MLKLRHIVQNEQQRIKRKHYDLCRIDTNVLVSALWTKDDNAPTYRLARLLMDGGVKTLYNNDILAEYTEVLNRDKFGFNQSDVKCLALKKVAFVTGIRLCTHKFERTLTTPSRKTWRQGDRIAPSLASSLTLRNA